MQSRARSVDMTCNYSENSRRLCGRLWDAFGGSRGKLRESLGKIAGNFFQQSRNARKSRISGTGKGKPAASLGSTLPRPCPNLPCGVFFEIDSSVPTLACPLLMSYSRDSMRAPSRMCIELFAPSGLRIPQQPAQTL